MGVMENDHIVTGFNVLNGDLLMFTTKRKVYGYGLSMNNENYMRIEEICEHECESSTFITSYSNTLRTYGTDEAPALLLHSTSFNQQPKLFQFEECH
jgi:hypothetical protein